MDNQQSLPPDLRGDFAAFAKYMEVRHDGAPFGKPFGKPFEMTDAERERFGALVEHSKRHQISMRMTRHGMRCINCLTDSL